MQIDVFESTDADTAAVMAALMRRASERAADFVFLTVNAEHDADAVGAALRGFGHAALHGATSCLGAMTHRGPQTEAPRAAAALLICDPQGDYGTGLAAFGEDPRAAARQATLSALAAAGRPGEVPDLVLVTATPGQEEAVLAGLADAVGSETPIFGGSAADNAVAGGWFVFAAQGATAAQGVAVSVLFPSVPFALAYRNGHEPTRHSGRATRVDGRRLIEIDGRPAAQVYADWTGGAIPPARQGQPRSILPEATLWPLGRRIGTVRGIDSYLLAHPARVETDGSLSLFASLSQGEVITQMTGDPAALADRAGRVAAQARAIAGKGRVVGALTVYCGGCMLQVRDRLDRVVAGCGRALGDAPFLGYFSFGEQGPVLSGGNRHGNLMISCLVFVDPT